jgi:hypothetical protein
MIGVMMMGLKRAKSAKTPLNYSWDGEDCFVVKFDPRKVDYVLHENEVRFVAKDNMLRVEYLD